MKGYNALKKELFREIILRKDVYAVQDSDGSYHTVQSPLTADIYLSDDTTVGAYQLDFNNQIKWICIDIDVNKNALESVEGDIAQFKPILQKQALQIQNVFGKHDFKTLIEDSGRRGYHIWVFFDKPTSAKNVRMKLKHLEQEFSLIDDRLHWEIFPKQDSVSPGGYGSLIKMPLQPHKVSGNMSCFVDSDFIEYLPDILPITDSDLFLEGIEPLQESTAIPDPDPSELFYQPTEKQLIKLLNNCAALSNCPQKHTNPYRVFVGAVFGRIGRPDLVHQYIKEFAPDYDQPKTDYHSAKMVEGMDHHKPVSCKFAIENGLCNGACKTHLPFDWFDKRQPLSLNDLYQAGEKVDFASHQTLWDLTEVKEDLKSKLNQNILGLPLFTGIDKKTQGVNTNINEFIDIYTHLFSSSDKTIDRKLWALPGENGIGKSVATKELLVDAVRKYPHFGAVVVLERIKDVKEWTRYINEKCTAAAKKSGKVSLSTPAYAMYGWEPGDCKKGCTEFRIGMCRGKNCGVGIKECRVKRNYYVQYYYPILIMTHRRFQTAMDVDDMDYLSTFKPSTFNEVSYPRTHLIIDEQPNLVRTVRITSEKLDMLVHEVTAMSVQLYKRMVDRYSRQFPHPVFEIKKLLEKNSSEWRKIIKAKESPGIVIHPLFRADWEEYTAEDPELAEIPDGIKFLHDNGGIYTNKNLMGFPEITTGTYANWKWNDFDRIIILDGTANISPVYKPHEFKLLYSPKLHTYEHLKIHHYHKIHLSRNRYKNDEDLQLDLIQDIKKLSPLYKKLYIVTYKEQLAEYEKEFERQITNGTIIVRSLGSTRGDNSMRTCDAIVFTGLIHKGETHYLARAKFIYEQDDLDIDVFCDTGRIRRFKDENSERVKMASMLEDFVQETYRTQLRLHNVNQNVHVYLINSDPEFLGLIKEYFMGCKIENWIPLEVLKNRLKGKALEIVESVVDKLKNGTTAINKSDLGIKADTLTRTLKRHPEIEKVLSEQGIEITRKTFKIIS